MSGNVLVTGAAGFVGLGVARSLAAAGWRVTGLDRTPPPVAAPFANFVTFDLLDEDVAVGPPFDAVVHLAGALPGRALRRDLFAVNVGATSAVLAHYARPGGHVVFFSTGLVYGNQPGPFREDLPCLTTDPYGQSKLAAEALLGAWARATEASVAVFRPSVIYGPGAPTAMLLASLLQALRTQSPFPMTPGEQQRDFIHVDDVARAVALALTQRANGTWNLAAGESCSVRAAAELGAAIAELLRIGALPYRANEVFDYRFDVSALQRNLGWRPQIPLALGLKALWEEMK